MAGYFSFHKMITTPFVKVVYFLGFIALTVAGVGLSIWAGMGLRSATIPTQQGLYYIAIGAGAVIVGNLVWRVICEFWIVLFNMHDLLASIDRVMNYVNGANETASDEIQRAVEHQEFHGEQESGGVRAEAAPYAAARPASVLGLS